MGFGAKSRPLTHFGVFLARKSHLAATFLFFKCPKKKQLYRKEVPERGSKIYTNKNIRGNLEFPGRIPPGYMSGRNTVWWLNFIAFAFDK